jgi:AcrR family transcriptional regulator
MEDTVYRPGNLREAVLARAVVALRTRGAADLSLRELARDLGVSHTAPARHFADRQTLLDALAVEGFLLLGTRLRSALRSEDDPAEQARSLAHAYVDFGATDANLVNVMYQHDAKRDGHALGRSARAAFAPLLEVFQNAEARSAVPTGGAERSATLLLATLQGITALAGCGAVAPQELSSLIDDAVPRYISRAS